jgi:hypothetical protein
MSPISPAIVLASTQPMPGGHEQGHRGVLGPRVGPLAVEVGDHADGEQPVPGEPAAIR